MLQNPGLRVNQSSHRYKMGDKSLEDRNVLYALELMKPDTQNDGKGFAIFLLFPRT